jgi:hypothetical protein
MLENAGRLKSSKEPVSYEVKYENSSFQNRSHLNRRRRRKCNRVTLFLRDINTRTWPSRLGESRFWESKMWSKNRGRLTWKWRSWRGPAAIVNDRPILSSKRILHKKYNRKCSAGRKNTDRESQGACHQDELIGVEPTPRIYCYVYYNKLQKIFGILFWYYSKDYLNICSFLI